MQIYFIVCLIGSLVLSVITFLAYGFDKRRAQGDRRRVPENTLHLLAILGGWPGGIAGQRVFRHKTQKTGFLILFWFCACTHIIGFLAGAYAVTHFQ